MDSNSIPHLSPTINLESGLDFTNFLNSPDPLNAPISVISDEDIAALSQGSYTATTTAEYSPDPSHPATPVVNETQSQHNAIDLFGGFNCDIFTPVSIPDTKLENFNFSISPEEGSGQKAEAQPNPIPANTIEANLQAQLRQVKRQLEEVQRALELHQRQDEQRQATVAERQVQEASTQEAAEEKARQVAEQAQAEQGNGRHSLPAKDPKKPWVKPGTQTQGLNRRPENIAKVEPAKHYQPLLIKPQSWGTINPSTNEPLFQYTVEGELRPDLRLTQNQIIEYICTHPLHTRDSITGELDGKNSNLRLYIQLTPADSSRRYPTADSSRCRFTDCPIPRNTISKGQYRVCFDELSYLSLTLDPFHNAGYLHLYCLEKCLNFPEICKNYNVLPDDRTMFPEGKSKMSIIRDSRSMKEVVWSFFDNAQVWPAAGKPVNWYQSSLSLALTKEHLRCELKSRTNKRAERGGNHIEIHMNDLDLLARNKEMIYVEKVNAREQRKKRKASGEDEERGNRAERIRIEKKPHSRKRKADDEEDEVEDEEKEQLQRVITRPRQRKEQVSSLNLGSYPGGHPGLNPRLRF